EAAAYRASAIDLRPCRLRGENPGGYRAELEIDEHRMLWREWISRGHPLGGQRASGPDELEEPLERISGFRVTLKRTGARTYVGALCLLVTALCESLIVAVTPSIPADAILWLVGIATVASSLFGGLIAQRAL